MKITILTIPHSSQRYATSGDWRYLSDNNLLVCVSELGCWKMEACLGVHELAEAFICRWQGVSQDAVDAFDMNYTGDGEPGDDPASPYRVAHRVASGIEFLLAMALDMDWKEYEERIQSLG